jgi:hypothetical protein
MARRTMSMSGGLSARNSTKKKQDKQAIEARVKLQRQIAFDLLKCGATTDALGLFTQVRVRVDASCAVVALGGGWVLM